MSPVVNLFLLIIEIWFLSGILLTLHWFGKKIGLTPLFVFMGGLTGALQIQGLGWVSIEVGTFSFNLVSHTLLPVLLFGLLIIYVINGTIMARGILLGMLLVTISAALFQVLLPVHINLPGGVTLLDPAPGYTPRILFTSIIAFPLDLIILILVYQTASNIRSRFPSRFAGGLALLIALWIDALIFSAIGLGSNAIFPQDIFSHLVGNSIAGLALFPLLLYYLHTAAPKFPDSAAAIPRPALDFFTTSMQLEARASHHYRLLQTLCEINKLVFSSIDSQTLFQEACKLIAKSRDYQLVFIALIDNGKIIQLDHVGENSLNLDNLFSYENSPWSQALNSQQPVVSENINSSESIEDTWQELAAKNRIKHVAAFPMRHSGRVFGILNVSSKQPRMLDDTEIEILENLADDLAYALVSIQAREQQVVLQTAAETMRDGLLIADLKGKIIYVNSIVARIISRHADEIIGQNIADLLPEDRTEGFQDAIKVLIKRGRLSLEINYHSRIGKDFTFSTHSALVRNKHGQPQHIAINIRDITHQRQYENQLLTLNILTSNLVQIHDIQDLMKNTLEIIEEMLGADGSLIYTLDSEIKQVAHIRAHNLPHEFTQRIVSSEVELPGDTAIKTLEPVLVLEMRGDPTYGEHLQSLEDTNMRSLLALPIIYQDVGIGVLIVCYKHLHTFDEERIQLGMTFAQTLAIIIQNARLYEAEQHQHQLAEALIQAAGSLNSTLDLEEVFDEILDQVMNVVSCQSANIMMVDDDHGYVRRYRGYKNVPRYAETLESLRIPISTPNIKTMLNGDLVLVSDTQEDPSWELFPGTEWIKSYVGIPLIIEQNVIGFLNVNSDVAGFFTEEKSRRLKTFADHAAIAYQNADLYQQLQYYASELETRVQKRTVELIAAKDQVEGILTSVPDAVFVLNQDNKLVRANHAGELLLEKAKDSNQDLFSPEFLTSIQETKIANLNNLLEVGERSYQARTSEMVFDETQPTSQVIVYRDVTHFKEIDQLKSQFVSDVSHELRTPLTNLTLYLGFLDNEKVYGNQRTYLDILKRETERLTHLIEDMLTFSRIQVGKIGGNIKHLDVNRIMQQMTIDRAFLAAQKEIRLEYTPLVELPPAMADENWLSQALSNLFTNAINYTHSGGKVLLQTNVEARKKHNWVVIHVIDNGVGIAESEIPFIFDRFYRGSASQITGAEGTGLGLAISKELVARMGGHITLESKLGEGSTFTIWLRPSVSAML
jgi:PAS domain S-box-containing protein